MKPKVLFILHVPPPINGAAIVGQSIKSSKLVNETFDAKFVNLATSYNLEEIGKLGIGKLLNALKLNTKVLNTLLRNRYDLCYMTLSASGLGFYKDVATVFILKLFRNKIIYHFHNKGVRRNSKKRFNRFLYRFVFKNTTTILLSKRLYVDFKSYIKKEDVYFCANGVPDLRDSQRVSDEMGAFSRTCKFLFLSNMMMEKGVYVLLEACVELKKKERDFQCHFVGAWSDVSEVEFKKFVKDNDLEESVFSHGPKYNGEKTAFFKNSDVFVFPTFYHNESFPLVNIEAMQFGLPVISTHEGGIPDMIVDGENGFLVHQNNTCELISKMEELINDKELRVKMGIAGKNRYESNYTMSIFDSNMVSILKDVVSN